MAKIVLRKRVNKFPPGVVRVKCILCSKEFLNMEERSQHMQKDHQLKKYVNR